MFIPALVAVALSFFGSANCDNVDPITGLSACETSDIEKAVAVRRAAADNNKTEAELQYATVCVECFSRHLACGKRSPSDVKFACLVEADSDETVGSDATEEAK